MPLPAIKHSLKPSSRSNPRLCPNPSTQMPDYPMEEDLEPCPVCLRTFSKTAIIRHAKVCEKVQSKPKRAVFKVSIEGDATSGSRSCSLNSTPILSRYSEVISVTHTYIVRNV